MTPGSTVAPDAVSAEDLISAFAALRGGANAAPASDAVPLRFAGEPVALRLSGTWRAAPIPDAFTHLVAPPHGPAGLVIRAWDTATTGITPGPLPPPGTYRSVTHDLHLTVFADARAVEAVDLRTGLAIAWCHDATGLPDYLRYRPFAQILARWLPPRNRVFLHVAAVGDAEGAALLVGFGNAGKSTTSLACAQRGLPMIGDDFCLLDLDGAPTVWSAYRTVKLRPDSAVRFGLRAAGNHAEGDACSVLDPKQMSVAAPVRSVVVLTPGPPPIALRTIPAGERRDALVSTGLLAGIGGDTTLRPWLRAVHALATNVPMFTLNLDWDLDAVVQLVDTARHASPEAQP